MYTPAVTHDGENTGKSPVDGILVEFKAPAAGTATMPSARDNMAIKVLAEGPRATRTGRPPNRRSRNRPVRSMSSSRS